MRNSWIKSGIKFGVERAGSAAAAAALLVTLAPVAFAQDAPPPAPRAPSNPGLIESIGRWFDQGSSNFQDHLRGAKRSMDDLSDQAAANNKGISDQAAKVGQGAVEVTKGAVDVTKGAVDVTKNAVDAVAKLPTARMTAGRERCAVAPNGAPDCVVAAETLCRKQGYSTGKSMDFTSAEECPTTTLLGQTSRDECTTVTFISRAMCQ